MRMHIRTRMQRRPAHTHRDAHTHTKTGAGDQGSNPALGKQRSRVPDRCPATPTLPDTNFRYQESLDWRKWTKGECSSVPSFVRAVLIELSWQLSGTSYDSRRGRPEFEPCLGQAVVTCTDVPQLPRCYNLRYQEALDWLKWTKGGCSFLLLSAQIRSSCHVLPARRLGRDSVESVQCSPDKSMLLISSTVAREADGYRSAGFSRQREFMSMNRNEESSLPN